MSRQSIFYILDLGLKGLKMRVAKETPTVITEEDDSFITSDETDSEIGFKKLLNFYTNFASQFIQFSPKVNSIIYTIDTILYQKEMELSSREKTSITLLAVKLSDIPEAFNFVWDQFEIR